MVISSVRLVFENRVEDRCAWKWDLYNWLLSFFDGSKMIMMMFIARSFCSSISPFFQTRASQGSQISNRYRVLDSQKRPVRAPCGNPELPPKHHPKSMGEVQKSASSPKAENRKLPFVLPEFLGLLRLLWLVGTCLAIISHLPLSRDWKNMARHLVFSFDSDNRANSMGLFDMSCHLEAVQSDFIQEFWFSHAPTTNMFEQLLSQQSASMDILRSRPFHPQKPTNIINVSEWLEVRKLEYGYTQTLHSRVELDLEEISKMSPPPWLESVRRNH